MKPVNPQLGASPLRISRVSSIDVQSKAWDSIVFQQSKSILDFDLNVMQRVLQENIQQLSRTLFTSGFINNTTAAALVSPNTTVRLADSKVNFFGTVARIANPNGTSQAVDIDCSPYTSSAISQVFLWLELWFQEIVPENTSEAIDGSASLVETKLSSVTKYGGDSNSTLTNELKDTGFNAETTRRIQVRWRIRQTPRINPTPAIATGYITSGSPNSTMVLDAPSLGTFASGYTIAGTGIPAGTTIVSAAAGGGAGTYTVSGSFAAGSSGSKISISAIYASGVKPFETLTGSATNTKVWAQGGRVSCVFTGTVTNGTTLNVSSSPSSGYLAQGQTLTGQTSGGVFLPDGTTISAFVTGTGGTGQYTLSQSVTNGTYSIYGWFTPTLTFLRADRSALSNGSDFNVENDTRLYVAGSGSATDAVSLNTVDGRVYALPIGLYYLNGGTGAFTDLRDVISAITSGAIQSNSTITAGSSSGTQLQLAGGTTNAGVSVISSASNGDLLLTPKGSGYVISGPIEVPSSSNNVASVPAYSFQSATSSGMYYGGLDGSGYPQVGFSAGGVNVALFKSTTTTFTSGISSAGAITASTGLTVTSGGASVAGGLTVSSGGASITGNSTIAGTLSGLTGLTVASGGATITAGNVAISSGNLSVTGNISATGTVSANGLVTGTGFQANGGSTAWGTGVSTGRFLGQTNNASPSGGTYLAGDFIVDIAGYVRVYTGSAWIQAGTNTGQAYTWTALQTYQAGLVLDQTTGTNKGLAIGSSTVPDAGNLTASGTGVFGSTVQTSGLVLKPTTGTQTISPNAANTGTQTFTLPVSGGNLVTDTSSTVFTYKTFDTAGTSNVFKINTNSITAVTGTGSTVVLSASPSLTGTVTAYAYQSGASGNSFGTSTGRYLGTATGAPTGGTYASGDFVIDPNGYVRIYNNSSWVLGGTNTAQSNAWTSLQTFTNAAIYTTPNSSNTHVLGILNSTATLNAAGTYTNLYLQRNGILTIDSATASTSVSSAVTLSIAGVPIKSGTATLTNAYGLKIDTSTANSTTAYGAYIDAPTGATTNYALYIATGSSYFAGTTTFNSAVTLSSTINKVTITVPANSATITIADGKTFSLNNTLTFGGTDGSTVTFGGGGTVLYSGGALGTPSSATLTNATGLPVSGISGLATGIATFLATPTSANVAAAVTDETGWATGAKLVFSDTPSLSKPAFDAETFSTASITAGTDALAQGPLTGDYNVVTVTSSTGTNNGVTLPTATVGRRILVVNKGTKPINVYPGSASTAIDGLGIGNPMFLPINGVVMFNALTTTQWYSTANSTFAAPVITGNPTFSSGSILSGASASTLTLPTAVDTLVGRATIDTLTNKTFDTAGNGNSFSINSNKITAVNGTTTPTNTVLLDNSPTITTPTLTGVTTLGAGNGTGAPVSATLSGASAATVSNTAGANLSIIGGKGTGNAAGGYIDFLTAPAQSSGGSQNPASSRLRILASGFVGVNTTSPVTTLDVSGDITTNNHYYNQTATSPSAPGSNKSVLYAKQDNNLYYQGGSTGGEVALTSTMPNFLFGDEGIVLGTALGGGTGGASLTSANTWSGSQIFSAGLASTVPLVFTDAGAHPAAPSSGSTELYSYGGALYYRTAGGSPTLLAASGGGASTTTTNTFTQLQTFSSGIAVTGNSTVTGTLGGITGLTVVSGGASITSGTVNLVVNDSGFAYGHTQTGYTTSATSHTFNSSITSSTGAGTTDGSIKTAVAINSTNTWSKTGATGTAALVNRALYATASGGQVNYAAIFDQGSVGIGTTSPAVLLDVAGASRFVSPGSGSNGGVIIRDANADPGLALIQFTNNVGTTTYTTLTGKTGGLLGVNNTQPTVALDVVGAGKFSNALSVTAGGISVGTGGISITAGGLVVSDGGSQHSSTAGQTADYIAHSFSATNTSATAGVKKTGVSIVSTGSWGSGTGINQGLYVSVSGAVGANYPAIFMGGNVGIGTATPSVALEVSGAVKTSSAGVLLSGSNGGTTTLQASSSASGTITFPAITGTVITSGDTGTVTSAMISDGAIVNGDINGSAAIAVSKLAASTISGVTLGNNLNALTIGTGLSLSSGTTYDGSTALTLSLNTSNSSGYTWTGPQIFSGTITTQASQQKKITVALATATTLDATHHIVVATTGNYTYTLPLASSCAGREYIIKRFTSGTVSIAPSTGDNIEDKAANASFSVPVQYDSYTFVSGGSTTWYII